jgi:hypothetical protein
MQSNAHSRDRQGKWNVDGLEGAALQIVSSDEKAAKWETCPELCVQVASGCSVCSRHLSSSGLNHAGDISMLHDCRCSGALACCTLPGWLQYTLVYALCCSWLAKIEAVKRLLVDDAPDKKPEMEALAAAYVYLQWIATGAIQCVEGGGHHRPNRHGEHPSHPCTLYALRVAYWI